MVAKEEESTTSKHTLTLEPTLTTVQALQSDTRSTIMHFPLNSTDGAHNNSQVALQLDGPTTGTPAEAAVDTGGGGVGWICCCTTTTSGPLAEMNMPSLIRWFTITGIIFGLVIFFGIINIVIFHRQEITKRYKKHFPSRNQRCGGTLPGALLGDAEAQYRGAGHEGQRFTNFVGQLGYWLRKS